MINLLLVDDEEFTREGIIDNLPWQEIGVDSIIHADDGLTAIEAVKKAKPDIILTDVRMIRMNGIEMSKRIREMYPNCKIIFMSGYSDKEYLLSAIQLKAHYYIEKPIKLDEMRRVIEEVVKVCQQEEHDKIRELINKKKLDISIPIVKNKLALLLLNENYAEELINEFIDMDILDLQDDMFFTTAVIKVVADKEVSDVQLGEYMSELEDYIQGIFTDRGCSILSAVKDKEFLIVHIAINPINRNILSNRNTQELFERLYDLNKQYKLFIAVGNNVKGLKMIYQSYRTAMDAMQKAFFRGFRFINFYTAESNVIETFSKEVPEEFFQAITEDKRNEAAIIIRKVTSGFRAFDNVDSDIIKDIYYKAILFLYKQIEKYGVSTYYKGGEDKNQLWKVINNLNTLDEVMEFTLDKVKLYFEFIDSLKQENQTIINIYEYIKKNYMNPDLGVTEISSNTFLSPAYMCTHFKQVTGKTINQYVTEYRIEKAREFLLNKEYKISEVAKMVGYEDSNYFTRLFKKTLGILPSEYREKAE